MNARQKQRGDILKRILSLILTFAILLGSFQIVSADVGKTPIIGPPTTTVAQMKAWAKKQGADPDFIEQAQTFYDVSVKHGIDPAVTYAQSAKETNYFKFTGVVSKDHFNPCGLKITVGGSDTDKQAHKKFKDWNEGITAQVHHLALYAGQTGFPYDEDKTPDPRHFPFLMGTAKHVEDLGAKWAPSKTYGWETAIVMYSLQTTLVDGKDPIPGPSAKPVIPDELKNPVKPVEPAPNPNPEPTPKPQDPVTPEKPEPPKVEVPDVKMQRLFGDSRITTATRVSTILNPEKASHVFIASADNYADALVASALTNNSGSYNPILLNHGGKLSESVKAEIIRLGAKKVTVIGGTSLLPNSLIAQLASIDGMEVDRIAGGDRFETAVNIADALGQNDKYILANGTIFADALAVSAYSAATKIPVLLTNGTTLDAKTEAKLNAANQVIIIGGIKSVSGPIGDKLRQNGVNVSRVYGDDRYATSVEVAKKLFPQRKVFVVADGMNFPDSLVGAPLAAKYGGTLLLTNSKALPASVNGYLDSVKPSHIMVLGGNNSVSAAVYNRLDLKIK